MKRTLRMSLAAVIVATAMLPLSACTACTTIGYIYDGPAVVVLDAPLPSDLSLSACFGTECEPAALPR